MYRLEFRPEPAQGYGIEFWDDASSVLTATDVPVTAGETTSGTPGRAGASLPSTAVNAADSVLADFRLMSLPGGVGPLTITMLMKNTLELYQSLDEESKQIMRAQAECAVKATTCAEYQKCNE